MEGNTKSRGLNMHSKHNSKLLKLAIVYGCKTAKDFSMFMKKYSRQFEISQSGRNIIQPTLFSC